MEKNQIVEEILELSAEELEAVAGGDAPPPPSNDGGGYLGSGH